MFGATMQNSNWKTKKLADIATIFDGQHTTPRYTHTGVPFYSAENVSTGILPKYISVKEYESQAKHKKPQKGDILLTRIGSLGKNIIANWEGPYAIYVTIAIIRPNPTVLTEYLHHYLDSYTYQREFFSKALLTAYPQKINLEDLLSTKVSYPNIEEQRRIVEVLECWDKGIELVKKLIEQKELQKKYLMQQLLSGTRRFKGFTQKWETARISEIKDIIIEKGHSLTKQEVIPGNIPVIAGGQTVPFFHNKWTHNFPCITISASGAYAGYVWKHTQKIYASDCNVLYSNNYNLDFLYYVLKYNQNYLYYIQTGGAQGHIYASEIGHISIPFINAREQQAIAEVLSSADKEIDLLKQKLAKLEAQKKGLMLVLLTGKVRLK